MLKTGRELAFSSCLETEENLGPNVVLGVLFTFVPKYTMSNRLGTAFFSHICDVAPQWAPNCPVCVVSCLQAEGILRSSLSRTLFHPSIFSLSALAAYLEHLAGKPRLPPDNPFKPHSFRIGGHKYYTVHGMNPDLRDHLARRAITRCSLRYYRASPPNNLHAIRAFYKRIAVQARNTPTRTTSSPAPS